MKKTSRNPYWYMVWCAVLYMAGCTSDSSEPQATKQPMYFLDLSNQQQVHTFLDFLHSTAPARNIQQAHYYNNQAVSGYMAGNYTQAIEYTNQALTLRAGNMFGTAKSYNNLGVIYQAMGKYTEALELYQQAITLLQSEHKTEWETHARNNYTRLQKSMQSKPASGRVMIPPGKDGPILFVEAEE